MPLNYIDSDISEKKRGFRIAGMPLAAIALLFLSVVMLLVWSHFRLLSGDEFGFGLLSIDSSSSIVRLIHIELTKPVSFDPPGYNALIYGVIRFFGTSALAMRLPSICGYLLMQVCLFYFVRRIATERAAILAMGLPILMGVAIYSILARPYGVLLGLSALSMLSWQTVARRDSQRAVALCLLALSLALIVNTQYYGVLIFVPLCAAEFIRSYERRRMDIPVLMSIVAGMAGLIIAMPFARVLSQFSQNHTLDEATYHFIPHSYFWLFIGYEAMSASRQHLVGIMILVPVIALVMIFFLLRPRGSLRLPHSEAAFVVILSGLPVLAYLLARFVTHFVEARYIQPAMIGIVVILAILVTPLLQYKIVGRTILSFMFLAVVITGCIRIRSAKQQSQQMIDSVALSPTAQRNLRMFPGLPIYVTNHSLFEFVRYYAPSPEIRSRITLIYSRPTGLKDGVGADTAQQVVNMWADGVPNVAPYESIAVGGTEHLFVLEHVPWEWAGTALAEAHATTTYLGPAYGGDLVSARFP